MTPRHPKGFSLVELMVVIAIIAVMSGIAAPSLLDSIHGMRVNGAAREVLSDLRLARTMAIEKGKRAAVSFYSPSTGQLRVYLDEVNIGTYDNPGDTLIKDVQLTTDFPSIVFKTNDGAGPSDGVVFGSGNDVTFSATGSASAAGDVYLMPTKDVGVRNDRNRRVDVVAATGNVRIQSYNGTSWE